MAVSRTHSVLRRLSRIVPDGLAWVLTRLRSGRLSRQLLDTLTDDFLESLLGAMDLAFCLSRAYRRNIQDFKARYLFRTGDERVATSVLFQGADMSVRGQPIADRKSVV